MESSNDNKRRPPPAVLSGEPDSNLVDKLKRDPDNLDAKVDVGSDQSMDASDPPSVVRPGNNDPVPSSSSPGEGKEKGADAD